MVSGKSVCVCFSARFFNRKKKDLVLGLHLNLNSNEG